jgi:hypothetical protein
MFIIIWLVGVLLLGAAIIVVLVIQGFEIRPPAFRAPALRPPGNPLPFADDSFPPPVRDYLRTSLRGEAWLPENAAIWGRASFLKKKRWVSLRFKTLYLPGRAYFRRWQSVWVEAVWFPALFVMDKQIHWEEVSVLTANLIVPYKDGEESLTAFFDPQTCLLSRFSTLLVRPGFAKPQPWRVEFSEWQRINGIMIPFQAVFRWENDPQPYARWTIDGAALNLAAFPWLPESRLGK